jgi:hypothetical protein
MQAAGPKPGNQWNINGGFCGAWSTQQGALSVGAWISQDFVRKANKDQKGIEHNMHGDGTEGYEVMPSNVAYTANALKLDGIEWDYLQPTPQAPKFKAWLKSHLVKGRAIVWFPLCKGDPHQAYPGSAPNGGQCDHGTVLVDLKCGVCGDIVWLQLSQCLASGLITRSMTLLCMTTT